MDRSYLPIYEQMPAFENLHLGITTRVMAKQIRKRSLEMEQLQKASLPNSRRASLGEGSRRSSLGAGSRRSSLGAETRRSSKFLTGTAIPNSVIKADMQITDTSSTDDEEARREKDEYVMRLLKRLQPKEQVHDSIYDESVDREALAKIKKELQERSLDLHIKSDIRPQKDDKIAPAEKNKEEIVDLWQEIKEKRRISRRTSILAPLGGERRSTYESIKKAINNSTLIQQLIDANNLGEQKMKQMQFGKSLVYPEYSFAKGAQTVKTEESTQKLEETSRKVSVEKRYSSRRSFLRRKHSNKSSSERISHSSGSKSALKFLDEFINENVKDIKNDKHKVLLQPILKSEDLQAQTSFVNTSKK